MCSKKGNKRGYRMRLRLCCTLIWLTTAAVPVQAQRLLEEWRVRTTAGPEALTTGAAGVFWNPAMIALDSARAEVAVMNLHAPRITGISGLAAAGAYAVEDGRTTFAAGYEHVAIDGIEGTVESPEDAMPLDVAEDRFGFAVAHVVNARMRVGALVQYTRLPAIADEKSVIALGAGARFQPLANVPLHIAGMAATEGEEMYWMAGVDWAAPWRLPEWRFAGEYGVAGGQLAPGVTHRVAVTGAWRELAQLSLGVAVEPGGDGRTLAPVGAASVQLYRYRLGIVREQLPNEFGGAYSFRFSVFF
jgi:hypothetical protein